MKGFALEREKWWQNQRERMEKVVVAESEDEALKKVAKKFKGEVEISPRERSNPVKFVSLPRRYPGQKEFQPYIYLTEVELIS